MTIYISLEIEKVRVLNKFAILENFFVTIFKLIIIKTREIKP